jgi:predicted ATPase
MGRYAPTWLVQMPWLLNDVDLAALQKKILGTTRERMLREMAEVVEALAAKRPLVLWLEDLQWSDYSTLDLLSFLGQRHERAQLLVIGTYRPVDVTTNGHPLYTVKQELQIHRRCAELPLGFLTEDAVSEYLAMRIPEEARHAVPLLGRAIHRRTEGNPLFMVNVIDYLIAQNELAEDRAIETQVTSFVPENLRQMIEKQIMRLRSEELRGLEVASVAGMEFSAAAVAAGLGQEIVQIEEICAGLARRGQFLRTNGVEEWPDGTMAARYSFVHALYQEVLYDRLTAA